MLPPLLMLPFVPGMACGSRYSCAGVHGCTWHKRIPPRPGTVPHLFGIHRAWYIHSSGYWSTFPLAHCRRGIRLCSCSVPHGRIRSILWKPSMYTGSPGRCAGAGLPLSDAGNPMPFAGCVQPGHWWYVCLLHWRLHSCHRDLWWRNCTVHLRSVGTGMWNPYTISGSACLHGNPDSICYRILYGASLALSPVSLGGRWNASPIPRSYIYGLLSGYSCTPCAPDRQSYCGTRLLHCGCGRFLLSVPWFSLFGYNNPPSGVSGSYSRHSGRSPAAATASGCRILYGVVR